MKPPRNSSDGRLMVIVWSWLRTPALRFPSLGPDEKSLRGLLLEPANEEPGRAVSERKPSFPPVSRTVAAHMVRTHGALQKPGSHQQPPFHATRLRWQFRGRRHGFLVR